MLDVPSLPPAVFPSAPEVVRVMPLPPSPIAVASVLRGVVVLLVGLSVLVVGTGSVGCHGTAVTLEDRLEGSEAYAEGRYEDSRTAYERVLETAPEDPEAHRMLGLMDLRAGRPVQARTHLEVAYQHDWTHPERGPEIAAELARAMTEAGDPDAAFLFLKERAEQTGRLEDYLAWADHAERTGDLDAAAMIHREALVQFGTESVEPWVRLAGILESAGDDAAAVRRYRQAYAIAPDDPRVVEGLRGYYTVLGPTLALPPEP